MIYICMIPRNWANKRIGIVDDKMRTRYLEFQRGIKMDEDKIVSPVINFKCDKKYMYDVLPNNGGIPVVSKKVLELLLEKYADDFQYFKADIKNEGNDVSGYYILNVINKLNVIDMEKSKYSTYAFMGLQDRVSNIEYIAYKWKDLGRYGLARNADYMRDVLVDDKVKELFIKNNIKGVDFYEQPY